MDIRMICLGCMRHKAPGAERCPYCGFSLPEYEHHRSSEVLPAGIMLAGRYVVGKLLGKGGFGITYLGFDDKLQTAVAIKEYFPIGLCMRDQVSARPPGTPATKVRIASEQSVALYNKGLRDQEKEAVMLANISLPGVVNVKDFFRENETGYIVMKYVDGVDLRKYVREQGRRLSEREVLDMVRQVVISLDQIHRKHIIHRDISPDNIMIDGNGQAVLIDFGSARLAMADTNKSMTVLLKHGYAPPEQYSASGRQGSWTDVYALCATIYYLMTGSIPADAVDRMNRQDDLRQMTAPLAEAGVSERTQRALMAGLHVRREYRLQTMQQLYEALYGTGMITGAGFGAQTGGYGGRGNGRDTGYDGGAGNTAQPTSSGSAGRIVLIIATACAVIAAMILIILASTRRSEPQPAQTEKETPSATQQARDLFEEGMAYYTGSGGQQDYEKAKEAFEDAAEAGSAEAAFYLGYMYEDGLVTGNADYQTAREYYLRGREGGDMRASYRLGLIYDNGYGVAADPLKAAVYYQEAIDSDTWYEENWAALVCLAQLYETGQVGPIGGQPDYATARTHYTKAAEHGDINAAYRRGRMDYLGEGLDEPDYVSALSFFTQAADGGHTGAMNDIGRMYEKGEGGLQQDYTEARAYYEKAAQAGSAPALYNLGLLYENGYGVEQDIEKAKNYYRQAADAGLNEAKERLEQLETVYAGQ